MLPQMKEIVNRLNTLKYYLLAINILLISGLIFVNNLGFLPFKNPGDFLFFVGVSFILALYRPGWSFLFFIGTIALENINLAPVELGIMVRPYQLLGLTTFLAVGVRFITRRLNFKLPQINWSEYAVIVFVLGGFLGSLNAANQALAIKQSIIVISFAGLYFLVRIFIQNLDDIKKIIPFFVSAAGVVVIYGIWQNIRFMHNQSHFEVMPGRINATFSEPDWLGIFLVFLLTVLYVMAYNFFSKMQLLKLKYSTYIFFYSCLTYFLIILTWVALILTVARSAWLGAAVVTGLILIYWALKVRVKLILIILSSIVLAFGAVYFFKLTNFQLGNRVQSTTSGNQEITIACQRDVEIPQPLESVSELGQYACRHINLEELEGEALAGKVIKKVYRKDPNFSIRKEIYVKSWGLLKHNWIFGIGWGNISDVLGKDENGNGLNSSNLFLETWLGAGIFGLVALLSLMGYIIFRGKYFFLKKCWEGKFFREDSSFDFFYLFLILSAVAIVIPNLFNAGIMLGFLWVWMGVALAKR